MSKSFAFSIAAFVSIGCATASDPTSTFDSGVADSSGGDTSIDVIGDTPTEAGCFAPKKMCGAVCVDVTSDSKNCGTCGSSCGDSATCVAGACSATGCGKDEVTCARDGGTECANLLKSHDHCGDCSTACKVDEACVDAVCKLDCAAHPGTTACGTACVDLKTDTKNCGTCYTTCKPDQTCIAGSCQCPAGEIVCTGFPTSKCTNVQSDNNNCGTCGHFCDTFSGMTCTKGVCSCVAPKVSCPGSTVCIDTTSDNNNCGACGAKCDTSKSMACHGSKCVLDCGTTGTDCSGVCKFLQSDPANCGGCGITCATGQYCSAGVCTCYSGLTNCSGTCKDLKSDGSNCGFCGRTCTSGTVCSGGSCGASCGGGRTPCGTSCVDTTSDASNCGTCGKVCSGSTPFCSGSKCIAAPACKPSGPYRVLFYGPTQHGSFGGAADETPFLPSGSTVTSWDDATWRGKGTTDFKAFDLIIIGEGGVCPTATLYQAAMDTAPTWSAAVTGRVVVTEHDPVFHSTGSPGAGVFLKAVLQWAASGPGTGLYVAAECGNRKLDFMSQFGSFASVNDNGNTAHILLPSHGTMIGSTDASLSGWGSSFHGNITAFPTDFVEVESGTSLTTFPITVARDKTCL